MGRPGGWDVVDLPADPTPGEVWGVRSLSRGYRRIAQSAEEAGSILSRVKSTGASGVWIGEAGDAFREKIEDLPDHLEKCVDSFSRAAEALSGWASTLSALQSTADTNLERAREASEDLAAARTRLAEAEQAAASIMRAVESQQQLYDRYQNSEPPEWVRVPTAGELSRMRSERAAASGSVAAEQGSVDDAQARLDAAKRLVWEAKEDCESAAKQVVRDIEAAKDAGVPGDSWWEKIKNSDWWQVVVAIATVVVVVAAIVAIVFTGPVALVAAAVGLVVGAVLVADDVMSLAAGEMSPGEFLAMTAIGLIPGGRGARAAARAGSAAADGVRAADRVGSATRVVRDARTGEDIRVITLKPKSNWSDSQRAEFAEKVRRMNEHDLVKPERIDPRTPSFRRDYIRQHGPVPRGRDVDHIHELQLGGRNSLDNAWDIDRSVNRSVGSQIRHRISGHDPGTRFRVDIDWGG